MKSPLALVGLVFTGLALAACDMPPGTAIERPITRTFKWFGYVGGDDIRAACAPGRNHIRAVYNGLWEEQVRAYDIVLQPDGSAALTSRVIGEQGIVSIIEIYDLSDVTSPWNARRGQKLLSRQETSELVGLMQQSAAFGPPRAGMRLPDNDFWWSVASCRNGLWGFQAYHYPTDGFVNARFGEKLFALDPVTTPPVNRPRKLEPAEMRYDAIKGPQRGRADRWMLVVGRDGLAER